MLQHLKQLSDFICFIKFFNLNYTISDAAEGTTENEFIIRSEYSSRIFFINNVPKPEPVPPPLLKK